MKLLPVPEAHTHLLRLHPGDILPDTLLPELRKLQATGGWLTLSGVVADVELAAFSAEIDGLGGTKSIAGPIQAVTLEGNIGVHGGDLAVDLRVVLARETDRGLETIAGHLVRAKVVGLEGSVTLLGGTVIPRAKDAKAGLALFRDDAVVTAAPTHAASPPPPPVQPSVPAPRPSVPAAAASSPSIPVPASSWSDVVAASGSHPPPRPPKRVVESEDGPYPVAGDFVEHFAFGSCEVLKSDGDRLHVRMKDGRIREIAVEMLKVTLLGIEGVGGDKQRYRLDRKV